MEEERVVIGRIVRAHGVRGDLLVAPTGEDSSRFARGQKLYAGPAEPASLTVQSCHDAQGFYRLHFAEVSDRNEAEQLIGRVLYQDASDLPRLPEGSFYHYQLVGLEVLRADGTRLGSLVRVHALPGADLYEVHDAEANRAWMIPARRELVEEIDLPAGALRLRPCDDLLAAVESKQNREKADRGSRTGSRRGRKRG